MSNLDDQVADLETRLSETTQSHVEAVTHLEQQQQELFEAQRAQQAEQRAQLDTMQEALNRSNQRNLAQPSQPRINGIPSVAAVDTRESDLISRFLGRIKLYDKDTAYPLPNGTASVSPSSTGGLGKLVYSSSNRLEKLLLDQQVAIGKLVSGTNEDKREVQTWLSNQTAQTTREAINDLRDTVVLATRHDNALASLEKIQPPSEGRLQIKLGSNVLEGRVKKDFKGSIGNECYSLDESDKGKPWWRFVQQLAAYIENHKLNSAGAYALACTALTGNGLKLAMSQERSGVSYTHFWTLLQSMGHRYCSAQSVVEEIARVKNTIPNDMNETVAQIMDLNSQLHVNVPEASRMDTWVTSCMTDLQVILQSFYPHLLATIMADTNNAQIAHKVEMQCLENAGQDTAQARLQWHPLTSFCDILIRATRGARLISRGSEGLRFKPPRAVHAISDGAERYTTQKGQRRTEDVASMVVQTGSQRGKFPRTSRGTFVSRGGSSRPRGGGQQGSTSWNSSSNGRAANSGRGRNWNPNYTPKSTQQVHAVESTGKGMANSNLRCDNCNIPNHRWRECRRYQGMKPGNNRCSCGGQHAGQCKAGQPIQPAGKSPPGRA